MSGTRIGPAPPAGPSVSSEQAPRPVPSGTDLAEALAGLAGDLLRDSQASRLAKAQAQVEALHYAAQLAVARGDIQALRGLSAEAGRISRDLAASDLPAEQVAAIAAQAQQVSQSGDPAEPAAAEPAVPTLPVTDIIT